MLILSGNSEPNRATDGAANIGYMWVATINTGSRRGTLARS